MNIAELKAAKSEVVAKAKKILDENPDGLSDEDLATVEELQGKATDFDSKIEKAQKQVNLRAAFADGYSDTEEDAKSMNVDNSTSLGDHFVKHAEPRLKSFSSGDRYSVQAPEFKAASDASLTSAQGQGVIDGYATEYQRAIVNQRRERLVAADLMGSARMNGAVIKYLVEKAERIAEGGAGTVAEGAKKPYVRYNPLDLVTESPAKIAALTKISDEMIEDLPFLADYINQQLVYDLSVKEEEQLLKGDGSASNLTGLFNREGIQTLDIGTGDAFDGLLEAIQMVALVTPLTADGILLNPSDFQALRIAKDNNGQYLAGGPFQGQYGNGGIILNPSIWGLKVISTPAVDKGTYMVGAFRQGATVLRRGGIRVDATNSNVDDFENNLSTLRAEERLGLMVPRPAAFVTGSINGGGDDSAEVSE